MRKQRNQIEEKTVEVAASITNKKGKRALCHGSDRGTMDSEEIFSGCSFSFLPLLTCVSKWESDISSLYVVSFVGHYLLDRV